MSIDQLEVLQVEIQPLRERLMRHPVYSMVNSIDRLRIFMEHHVFAVWDFMSLLKALQGLQTCTSVPWLPKREHVVARFVNEIVLGEESDDDGRGGYTSHFELYHDAMDEVGASTAAIDSLIESLGCGFDLNEALSVCGAKSGSVQFVRATWSFVTSQKPHAIAAAFSLGREDVIPDMFRRFVSSLGDDSSGRFERIKYYLARHIEVDEGSHGPMALKTIGELCGSDAVRWREATDAASEALIARLRLWDTVVQEIQGDRVVRLDRESCTLLAT